MSKTPVPFKTKSIEFSGFSWLVTESTTPAAPGPNFWSSDNVWIDEKGYLHLKITKDNNGIWHCAELRTKDNLGLGEYEFSIEGDLNRNDKNVVFGMFNYSGRDRKDEMDIEVSAFGENTQNILHYNVYPKKGNQGWKAITGLKLNGSYSTHRFVRSKSKVVFQSLHGFPTEDQHQIFSATCDNANIISTQPMPVYINLWLFNGNAPANGKEVEIIIHKFRFTPE